MKRSTILHFIGITIILLTTTSHSFSQFVNIPDANFKAALLANSSINTTPDGQIDSLEASNYTGALNLSSLSISDLTGIQCFINATSLDISYNLLTSVDLGGCYALTTLDCKFNALTCLDLGQQYNLVSVDCSNNGLLKLNMKNFNNTNVTFFNATFNSSLGCIQVDNVSYSTANWTFIDASAYFSADCGAPTASYTSDSPVCLGDTMHFTNTSTNAVSYTWNFGDGGSSPLVNPSHTYLLSGGYTVILTAHSDCYGVDNYSWNQYVYATNITGQVTYSGGNVTSGTVLLLKHEPFFTTYDTIDITPLNAVGEYTFLYPPAGDYLIKVYPDTTLFPDLIPTYKGDVWAWDSAEVFTHGCTNIDTADIYMYETPPLSGPGLLSGIVVEGAGFGRAQGDPIHGVDVKLGITGTGLIVANTETDTNGVYTFPNLPYGNYTIYADIPGLHRDSTYQIVIDTANNIYNNLDYFVDSNSVYIFDNVGIHEESSNIGHFGLFPNPANDYVNLVYSLKDAANVQVEIVNMVGIKLVTLLTEEQTSGEYVYNFNPKTIGMQTGIYFIRLSSGNKSKTLRLMVIE